MTPVPDPQGWGRTDGLLIKQPVRAEARRLFVGSGSLTWFRRPRLASPESTTEVEAKSPPCQVPTLRSYRTSAPHLHENLDGGGQHRTDGAAVLDDHDHLLAAGPREHFQGPLARVG